MRIAFAGAHRTGKTTLAQLTADRFGLPFLKTSTSQIAASMGIDLKAPLDFGTRMKFQFKVLDMLCDTYRGADFVTDRSPLDAAAYTLANVQASTGTVEEQREVIRYVDACMELARQFDLVLFVSPGIPMVATKDADDQAPAYQLHHHHLVRGMLEDPVCDYRWTHVPVDALTIEDRVGFVDWALYRYGLKPLDESAQRAA
jgi:hypothetical protein